MAGGLNPLLSAPYRVTEAFLRNSNEYNLLRIRDYLSSDLIIFAFWFNHYICTYSLGIQRGGYIEADQYSMNREATSEIFGESV